MMNLMVEIDLTEDYFYLLNICQQELALMMMTRLMFAQIFRRLQARL
jgi:hypothetical protein